MQRMLDLIRFRVADDMFMQLLSAPHGFDGHTHAVASR